MFLELPEFAWFVIGVIVVAVLVTVANWYIMYCVFDWAVHHVKHVWLEEKLNEYARGTDSSMSDYGGRLGRLPHCQTDSALMNDVH